MKNGSKKRRAWTSVQVRELKIACQKESAREEDCQVSEAHRRRDAAKSVQHRTVAGLARVTSRTQLELRCQQAPPLTCAGLVFSGLYHQRRLPQPPPKRPPPRRSRTTSKSMTAPMVALMIAETIPVPRWIPIRGSNQSPMNAPITPMMRSPMSPIRLLARFAG